MSNQEAFQSMATVFILESKTWIERGSGLVRFVFDLGTFALRLIIKPGTPQQIDCKLRPRIRSKGPRAYVVRAQADDGGTDEHILAVRFEREEDSRAFRRFVEKRDVDKSQKNHSQMTMTSSPHRKNTTYSSHSAAHHQQQINPYASPHHAVRSASNVAHNNAYTHAHAHAQSNQMMYSNPYGNAKTNYFWTCTACFQMVDPALTSCQICGTMRVPQPNVLQSMQYQQQQQQASYHPNYQNMQNPFATNHHHPSMSVYSSPPPKAKKQQEQVPIIKLTSVNLEKHNKLYPTKRKTDKESLLKKLIIINCQQAVVV